MKSSSFSEPLVSVKNLALSFNLPIFNQDSVRTVFTNALSHPLDFMRKKPKTLIVFENLSFDIYKGDRIGLVGVNGVGKTSLCRCIAKIYHPQKGEIITNGHVRAIFDTAVGIQPELTGRENAYLLSEFLYPHTKDRKALVEECLIFSELGDFLNTPYKYYSNGMQARLCLSLISAQENDLLILDEVFDGADQFFRKKISERIKNMILRSGAVIFVSHSYEQILQVCNRVLIIKNKQLIFDGPPEVGQNIYENEHGLGH